MESCGKRARRKVVKMLIESCWSDPVDRMQRMLSFFMSGLTDLVNWPKPAQQMLCNYSAMFQTLHMKLPVCQLAVRLKGRKEGKGCQLSFENIIFSDHQISEFCSRNLLILACLSSLSLDMGSESSAY